MKDYFKRVFLYQKQGMNWVTYKLRQDFLQDFFVQPLENMMRLKHIFKLLELLPVLYGCMVILLSPVLLPCIILIFLLIMSPLQAAEIDIYK